MRNTHKNSCESSTSDITDWSSIQWKKVEKYVNKQQKRIYSAEKEGNAHKVRNIQRMLTNSKSVVLLAVRRVTQINKGKRTPGIDGKIILTDKERGELVDKIMSSKIECHKPKPAYRKYIKKKSGKLRPLGIPVIIDRVYQEIVRIILEPQAEAQFEPTSYGFRPNRSVHDAIERIFNNIRGGKWVYVYEGDFKDCFNNLSHEYILEQLKGFPLKGLVERFLKAGYVDNQVFNSTDKGTPQGGLLSPLLANIALTGLEECLNISYKKVVENKNGSTSEYFRTKGKYRITRYADDFVIFAKTKEDIEKVPELLDPYLQERGLILAEDKTKITHVTEGFDFLGANCRLYNTKDGLRCFIKPSKDSIKKFKAKIYDKVKSLHGYNVDYLIDELNPIIMGAANFWSPWVSKEIFNQLDDYIWNLTFKFLCRMHKNKSKGWIVNKYYPFYYDGKHYGNWVLTGPKKGNHLRKMVWTPIKRHRMIKHNYSPYDKTKTEYFEQRVS